MPVPPSLPSRRTVLTVGSAAAAAAVVSACSSTPTSNGGSSTTSIDPTEPLAALADIADGGAIVVGEVLLARKGDTVTGHSAVCTHQGCTVAAPQTGDVATCPCHGSQFNAATGAVLHPPATSPLPEVAVMVKKGEIYRA